MKVMIELAEIRAYYDGDIDHMREVYHDYDVAKDEDGTMEISVPGMNVPVPLGCTVAVSSWEDSTFYFYVTDRDGECETHVRTR